MLLFCEVKKPSVMDDWLYIINGFCTRKTIPIWLPGVHFESDIAENQLASAHSHNQHAHEIWNWNSKLELHFGNHAAYRVQKLKNPIWPPGSHLTTWWLHQMETFSTLLAFCAVNSPHNITLTLPWDGAQPRKGPPGQKPRKRDSSLSGHWMGHLLSYSLSGGQLRGLNGPLTSHFIFSSHMYFSLNTPTHHWSPMPN